MKKAALIFSIILIPGLASAQKWSLGLESGMTMSKLVPSAVSSPAQGSLKYGFGTPGYYLSAEAGLTLNEATEATGSYQYSSIAVGTQHKLPGTRLSNYDLFDLHSLQAGIRLTAKLGKSLKGSFYIKSGFSYVNLSGMGSSGGGSGDPDVTGPVSSGLNRNNQFDLVRNSWVPMSSAGIRLAPVHKGWMADRLYLNAGVSMVWRDLYEQHASYSYTIQSGNVTESGNVYYKGMPFTVQAGLGFRLFDLGKHKKISETADSGTR